LVDGIPMRASAGEMPRWDLCVLLRQESFLKHRNDSTMQIRPKKWLLWKKNHEKKCHFLWPAPRFSSKASGFLEAKIASCCRRNGWMSMPRPSLSTGTIMVYSL
jgi:hypothetical protein